MRHPSHRSFIQLLPMVGVLLTPTVLSGQSPAEAVRGVIEAHARYAEQGNLQAMDTLWGTGRGVHIIEGAGVNHGWADYRDNHLGPELEMFENFRLRYHSVEPVMRGDIAWASFQYEVSATTPRGELAREGRGTAILERRDGRWLIVHLHTSGRAPRPQN